MSFLFIPFFSIFASKILLSLIFTDKKSTPECSPSNSPFLKSRSPYNAATSSSGTEADSANNLSSLSSLPVLNDQPGTEVPDGLAPIAKTEEMSDDLSEETLVNGESNPNSSTPKKDSTSDGTSDWRLTNGNGSVVNKSLASGDLPWWSEEDDDEKTDRKASLCNGNGNNKNNCSAHSVEDGFESFSCTDEEDEGDRLSLDSNSTSR